MIKTAYLVLYNTLCCIGWSAVLQQGVKALYEDFQADVSLYDAAATLYERHATLATALFWAQSAAILEILHSVVGLVRSPAMVTAMQVGSRLVALFALVHSAPAQSESCLYRSIHPSIHPISYFAPKLTPSPQPNPALHS